MRLILLLLGLVITGSLLGREYVFEHISSNDGLSNNLVRDIIQDEKGYLWFATSGGLNRYDGHSFETYKTIIGDTASLSDSRLSVIFEDLNGFIWARSTLGNVHRIDPEHNSVINFNEQGYLPPGARSTAHFVASNGDVWILHSEGLLRVYYLSDESTSFLTQSFDQAPWMENKYINEVFEDSEQNIWLASNEGLIRLFVPRHKIYADTPEVFSAGTVFLNIHEYDQKLFAGAENGELYRYDFLSRQFNVVEDIGRQLRGQVSSINNNGNGVMLIGTNQGELVHYEPGNNQLKVFSSFPVRLPKSVFISDIVSDSFGTFWLITENRGIYQYLPDESRFVYFGLNYSNREFLGEPDKQIILEDSNRNLWVGINGGGLFLYDRENESFQHFKHEPVNTGSLSSDIVLSLYEDRSKNLWIGTSYGGVNKISLKNDRLSRIAPVLEPRTGFDNYIRSVTTDVLGNVWFGSKAGKIYIYRNREQVGVIPDDLNNSDAFPPTNVYCMFFDNEHNLWIGTKGNGIYIIKSMLSFVNRLHHRDVEVVHLVHDPDDPNSLSSDNVYCIEQDVHGQYWIGTFLGGLDLLNNPFTSPEFRSFKALAGNENGIVSTEVRDLYFDAQQNLWIATSEGISILESKYLNTTEKKFINIQPSLKDEYSMSGKVIYQIKQSKNNDIFLAMLDGGINQLKAEDFRKRNFKWIHHKSQILSPNVYSIEEDYNGFIWMGTDNGLFRLNPSDGEIEKYHIRNSYLPLTFSETCSGKTTRQELVFGSNDGFLIFHPDSIQKDSTEFPLMFSKLEINGEFITNHNSKILSSSIETQKHIKLRHDQNNITLYFSVLDYEQPEAIQYSYYLEGYDSYWSNPSTTNNAMYRKIEPGSYVLKVKATNSSGTWMGNIAEMELLITPPFWKSTTGYILIILIASLLITVSTILVYRQIIIQNRIRIDQAITEKRMEYYTNISHEFKTPLALILNPAEEIILSHKSSDFARKKGLQIKRNATYLKRLIDQILDFRKIREGKMQLKVAPLNLVEFFREIYLVFLPLAQKMEIIFEYSYQPESIEGYADVRQLEKITYNLLSNAFRFTPVGKHVKLIISGGESSGTLNIKVEDEGMGIDKEELPHIFDRFYNSKNSSGIGLFFTKELVHLHRGNIEAFNNHRGGATFSVDIPVNTKAYQPEEIAADERSQLAFDLKSIDDIEIIVSHRSAGQQVHKHVAAYMESILVVEDNEEMRNYLSGELSAKYKLIEAEDGEKGLELARRYQPDLVVSDVMMPLMDGYELTRRLKDDFNTSHIPVILLTAESSDEKKIEAAECGADDFVVKPFNLNYLITKIEKTILLRKRLKNRFGNENTVDPKAPEQAVKIEADFMEEVTSYVKDNMSNADMNVEFLVEKMGISRTLFFKKMKAASGYAPNEYLRMIRMKEAARLINTTDKSINEISLAVGFNDSNYFGKTFKRHFGESPSVYKSNKSKRNPL
ncbi:hybrid sensor histidine kinase/response regulator transcription factor [Roseimarinus sediminis]|uniref:hybrid sensor histidine kinase/response regulator transcription factor n=1 Tax=Roseimarinus sediminis TaxID=1610899 RepID=UPI003D24A3EA